jgi:Legume-like lectin family
MGDWVTGGNTKVDAHHIALTQDMHQIGSMWHPLPLTWSSWQLDFKFQVRGMYEDGDHGFAFWLVDDPGATGDVFGYKDYFRGLSVIFDSKDDDGQRNNPSVAVHLYDGTVSYTHHDDGISNQLSGCIADYRNRPEPVSTRITYKRFEKTLEVHFDLSHSGRYQRCVSLPDIDLPRDYFIGFTADTDIRDDSHQILNLKVTDLTTGKGDDVSSPNAKKIAISPHTGGSDGQGGATKAADTPASRLREKIQQGEAAAVEGASQYTQPVYTNGQAQASQDSVPVQQAADTVVQHTKYVADTVDANLNTATKSMKEHVTENVAIMHDSLDSTVRSELKNVVSELSRASKAYYDTTTSNMEAQMKAIVDHTSVEINRVLQHNADHSEELLNGISSKLDQTTKWMHDVFQRQADNIQGIQKTLTSVSLTLDRMSKQDSVQQLQRTQRAAEQAVEHLQAMEARLTDRIGGGSSIGWSFYALIGVPLVLVSGAVLWLLKSAVSKGSYDRYKLP